MFSGETRKVVFRTGRKHTRSNKARREARAGGARNVVFDAVPDADNPSRGDAGNRGLGVPVYCGMGFAEPADRTPECLICKGDAAGGVWRLRVSRGSSFAKAHLPV